MHHRVTSIQSCWTAISAANANIALHPLICECLCTETCERYASKHCATAPKLVLQYSTTIRTKPPHENTFTQKSSNKSPTNDTSVDSFGPRLSRHGSPASPPRRCAQQSGGQRPVPWHLGETCRAKVWGGKDKTVATAVGDGE